MNNLVIIIVVIIIIIITAHKLTKLQMLKRGMLRIAYLEKVFLLQYFCTTVLIFAYI